MKVTLVSLAPTTAAQAAGAPALTPEMLAAVGARYSRNGEGLAAILEKVEGMDPDKAVDGIFRMVDYGHASIADMTPIPMFLDGVSVWLTYYVWAQVPRGSGQECSTRYLQFGATGLVSAEDSGMPPAMLPMWWRFIGEAVEHYKAALAFWENYALTHPEATMIPMSLLRSAADDPQGRDARQVERMRRTFAFDRARYWLPCAAVTNFMLLLSARDWVELCQNLLSHPVREAQTLGGMIRDKLALSAPRLIKHARATDDWRLGLLEELSADADLSTCLPSVDERNDPQVQVTIDRPPVGSFMRHGEDEDAAAAFRHHPHRYSHVGRQARRIHVRYGIDAVTVGELRDLNRHRTGYKHCPYVPVGFYGARDQAEDAMPALADAVDFGLEAAVQQRLFVGERAPWHVYWSLLGTQVGFEHGTRLDKMVYEIELRTGLGAHYRYARHMRDVHDALVAQMPELSGRILLGSAEPE